MDNQLGIISSIFLFSYHTNPVCVTNSELKRDEMLILRQSFSTTSNIKSSFSIVFVFSTTLTARILLTLYSHKYEQVSCEDTSNRNKYVIYMFLACTNMYFILIDSIEYA